MYEICDSAYVILKYSESPDGGPKQSYNYF